MLLALQSVPTITLSDALLVGAIGIAVNAFVQWRIGYSSRIQLEATLTTKVEQNTKDIDDLKDSRSKMWNDLNQHTAEIAVLKAQKKAAHHG
jgi:uncharacterized protein YlxW (UPF0749 family)